MVTIVTLLVSPGLKKSDVMVAAVTARICSTPKTPTHAVVARPTSAVKPTNISSKVDSGLSRAGLGRTPVTRTQVPHSTYLPPDL